MKISRKILRNGAAVTANHTDLGFFKGNMIGKTHVRVGVDPKYDSSFPHKHVSTPQRPDPPRHPLGPHLPPDLTKDCERVGNAVGAYPPEARC
jgi:hypothetical protein